MNNIKHAYAPHGTNQFGPWDYHGGAVYDLGRGDIVATGATTYKEIRAKPDFHLQPPLVCEMPAPGHFVPDYDRADNEMKGRLIAMLPALINEMMWLREITGPGASTPVLDGALEVLKQGHEETKAALKRGR